jgi:hypothetical protein
MEVADQGNSSRQRVKPGEGMLSTLYLQGWWKGRRSPGEAEAGALTKCLPFTEGNSDETPTSLFRYAQR